MSKLAYIRPLKRAAIADIKRSPLSILIAGLIMVSAFSYRLPSLSLL